ncbi:MAG: type II toxin-antitoxin system death-on-curing family toxin [Parachlamydia sp.]|nr:type II toxin-antitoxin system death-on-curing family toxin [Parachlamydia sp.]
MKTIYYLTVEQVIVLHDSILAEFGGLAGIRDRGLLESALDAPQVNIYGQEMYRTLSEKGAVYVYHLIKNHPFQDGNKRTAYASLALFYEINGLVIKEHERNKIEEICLLVANGAMSKEDLITEFKYKMSQYTYEDISPSFRP